MYKSYKATVTSQWPKWKQICTFYPIITLRETISNEKTWFARITFNWPFFPPVVPYLLKAAFLSQNPVASPRQNRTWSTYLVTFIQDESDPLLINGDCKRLNRRNVVFSIITEFKWLDLFKQIDCDLIIEKKNRISSLRPFLLPIEMCPFLCFFKATILSKLSFSKWFSLKFQALEVFESKIFTRKKIWIWLLRFITLNITLQRFVAVSLQHSKDCFNFMSGMLTISSNFNMKLIQVWKSFQVARDEQRYHFHHIFSSRFKLNVVDNVPTFVLSSFLSAAVSLYFPTIFWPNFGDFPMV